MNLLKQLNNETLSVEFIKHFVKDENNVNNVIETYLIEKEPYYYENSIYTNYDQLVFKVIFRLLEDEFVIKDPKYKNILFNLNNEILTTAKVIDFIKIFGYQENYQLLTKFINNLYIVNKNMIEEIDLFLTTIIIDEIGSLERKDIELDLLHTLESFLIIANGKFKLFTNIKVYKVLAVLYELESNENLILSILHELIMNHNYGNKQLIKLIQDLILNFTYLSKHKVNVTEVNGKLMRDYITKKFNILNDLKLKCKNDEDILSKIEYFEMLLLEEETEEELVIMEDTKYSNKKDLTYQALNIDLNREQDEDDDYYDLNVIKKLTMKYSEYQDDFDDTYEDDDMKIDDSGGDIFMKEANKFIREQSDEFISKKNKSKKVYKDPNDGSYRDENGKRVEPPSTSSTIRKASAVTTTTGTSKNYNAKNKKKFDEKKKRKNKAVSKTTF